MKRSSETSIDRRDKAPRRQDPISCEFCRSKKLRCDRQCPCSNCYGRRIPCVSAHDGARRPERPANQDLRPRSSASSIALPQQEVLERLWKLEEAVFSKNRNTGRGPNPVRNDRQELSQGLESTDDQSADESAHGRKERKKLMKSGIPRPVEGLGLNLDECLLLSRAIPDYSPLNASEIVRMLPTLEQARTLVDFYMEDINWAQHILHVPKTRQDVETVYADLAVTKVPNLSHVVLLASLMIITAYFWPSNERPDFPAGERMGCYSRWIALVQRVLWEMNHLTSPTLEILQAKLLLTHFLPVASQTTSRSTQHKLLVEGAHILQLHRADTPRHVNLRAKNGCDMVKIEIERRVWWSILITDWMLSAIAGPQHGTYLVHPDQMNVQYPSNVDDEDISSDSCCNQPFLGAPTEMTFVIAKGKFANIVRDVIDTANKANVPVDELEYGQVLTFDKAFNDYYSSLPQCFLFSAPEQPGTAMLYEQRPYLATQRSFLLFGYYTRLALLHRPYLVRSYRESYYEYSRKKCLDSTRMVVRLYKSLGKALSRRMWVATSHIFMAATTLMIDYSCLRHDPQHAAERRQEVLECYRLLDESKAQDPDVQRNLAKLHTITSEWKMAHTTTVNHPIQRPYAQDTARDSTSHHIESVQSQARLEDFSILDTSRSRSRTPKERRLHHLTSSDRLNLAANQNSNQAPVIFSTTVHPVDLSSVPPKHGNILDTPLSLPLLSPESITETSAQELVSGLDANLVQWNPGLDPSMDTASDLDWNSLFSTLGREQPIFDF